MTNCKRFAKTRANIFNSVLSRVMGLWSSKPSQTCLPPFFSNVITPLVTLPGMAPWANQWLNISVRIGTNMCDILKYTSWGKPSSPGDLLRPTCFKASRTSHSVTTPSQLAASGEVGEIATKLPEREISAAGKTIPKVRPKGVTYLTSRSQQSPVRGLDRSDVPIGEPSHLFFTRSRVRFHSFVENSF